MNGKVYWNGSGDLDNEPEVVRIEEDDDCGGCIMKDRCRRYKQKLGKECETDKDYEYIIGLFNRFLRPPWYVKIWRVVRRLFGGR